MDLLPKTGRKTIFLHKVATMRAAGGIIPGGHPMFGVHGAGEGKFVPDQTLLRQAGP